MTPVKRIEIVVPEHALREVLDLLEHHRPGGHTVMRGLAGKGDRGVQTGDGLVAEFSNALVLVACEPSLETGLLEALRPLLKRFGGMCLVSEARWLLH